MDYAETMNRPELPAREIGEITAEVKQLQREAKNIVLVYAIQIGRCLKEAKAVLKHGEWGDWLKNEAEFSQSSANNYMKLYEEYGSDQLSLFGNIANSQTIANLPYTKALQLLAVPAEDREEFVQENAVEDMSVRELQEAIRARDEAQKKQQEAERAVEQARKLLDQGTEERAALAEQMRDREARMDDVLSQLAQAREECINLQEELEVAKKAAEDAGDVDLTDRIEEIRQEEEKKAREAAREEQELKLKKQTDRADKAMERLSEAQKNAMDAEDRLKTAQQRVKDLEEELEQAKKRQEAAARAGRNDVAEFRAIFVELQDMAKKLKEKVAEIGREDPEMAEKLSRAMKAFGESL